jgi:peptidoglycan-associated lipoprotein
LETKGIYMNVLLLAFIFLLASCCRNSSQTWEDVKTAGRYMQRGVDSFCGKDGESRMFASGDQFVGPHEEEFIPLNDEDLRAIALNGDDAIPQPRVMPGEGSVPALHHFRAAEFSSVHFDTDEHILREKADISMVQHIVSYLKKNPGTYLLIEGHTDERAPASYNMALGMRRANHIRALMVKNGCDANRIYTVSHGKEQPLALGHSSEDWKKNRRAQFKIFRP